MTIAGLEHFLETCSCLRSSPALRMRIMLLFVVCGGFAKAAAMYPWERADAMHVYKVDNDRQCHGLCWYRQGCASYSYTKTTTTTIDRNCVLHSQVVAVPPQATATVSPEGWLSRNVSTRMVTNGCASRPCGATEVCVPALSQHRCLPLDTTHWINRAQTTAVTTSKATTARLQTTAAKFITAAAPTTSLEGSAATTTHRTALDTPTSAALTTTPKALYTAFNSGTGPLCPTPPLLQRTRVTRTVLHMGTADVPYYNCSVGTDVYINGTTTVACRNGTWPLATILCAPTTCWYNHPIRRTVYVGTCNTTKSGYPCDRWDADNLPYARTPIYLNDTAYTVDGSRSAANNYCRNFALTDNYTQVWCYSTVGYLAGRPFEDCDVSECPAVPGVLGG